MPTNCISISKKIIPWIKNIIPIPNFKFAVLQSSKPDPIITAVVKAKTSDANKTTYLKVFEADLYSIFIINKISLKIN